METAELNVPMELDLDLNVIQSASLDEIRCAVDIYYALQKERIHAGNRVGAAKRSEEPSYLMDALQQRFHVQEEYVKRVLHKWAKAQDMGRWALAVCGIGPVLSAGLLAHIDITRAASPSSVWRFAGLDPTSTWAKKTKRPWNARLKVICWKIGQSFLKCSGRERSLYGRLYREKKAELVTLNESGAFVETAAEILSGGKKWRDGTVSKDAYEEGRLPAGHLDARARRYVVKIFLSHWWEAAWRKAHDGAEAPNPWVLEHGGHVHRIEPEVPWDA